MAAWSFTALTFLYFLVPVDSFAAHLPPPAESCLTAIRKAGAPLYPQVRKERWRHYNIDELPLIPVDLDGQTYDIYNNANLSIVVTNACNAKCKFCVQELKYEKPIGGGVTEKEYATSSSAAKKDDGYFVSLENMLRKVIPTANPTVAITGGEATMDPRLPEILQLLNKYGVRKRVLTTNGSYLLKKVGASTKPVIDHLIDYKLQHLNISHAHYDATRNAQLMVMDLLPDADLKAAVEKAKANGIRPRLSVVLLKEGINSLAEMKKYLTWAKSIGVDNVVFRQLMLFDKGTTQMESVATYSEDQRAELEPIMELASLDPGFKFIRQVLGYYYYVEVYNYEGVDVVMEIADLAQIDRERERQSANGHPKVYEMIFHPKGSLNSSWKEWEDLLLAPVPTVVPLEIFPRS